MVAIVTSINPLRAKVRRASGPESVDLFRLSEPVKTIVTNLQIGDRIEVKRVTNNPYLVIVGMEKSC